LKPKVNNDYYNHLGEQWYSADDDPIAVLRAEQKVKNPWVEKRIDDQFGSTDLSILDVGCGGGFLSNYLSLKFANVSGLDASESSLAVAKSQDYSKKVNYLTGDAYHLPFADQSQDIVCAMDFLEHVDNPQRVIDECARVLKPGGLFFFHTFNRNWISWLIVIKFMEWFVPNTPKNLHVLHLFIKPQELEEMMKKKQLHSIEWVGLGPRFNLGFLKSLFKRRVTNDFSFKTGKSLTLGYMGYARKTA
jgi:2-polyprenyl-6-hydroxyphenyl methylase / 3-demethylubiquinone-9 3-methyltransferase